MLQYFTMCCSALQGVAMCGTSQDSWRLDVRGVRCSVLQCVAVCYNVLQCVAVCCNVWYQSKQLETGCKGCRSESCPWTQLAVPHFLFSVPMSHVSHINESCLTY